MKKKLKLHNDSIETAGLKKDYKDAIIEYIWNGFDAGATEVKVYWNESNTIDGKIIDIYIEDNGSGVPYENIENTFGTFLYSEKKQRLTDNINIRGAKGKGRYSFICFATHCKWDTIYKKDNDYYKFSIDIDDSNKEEYEFEKPIKIESNKSTGTIVHIYNLELLVSESFGIEFRAYILQEFAWFLYLNKENNFKLIVNDVILDYSKLINNKLSENQIVKIDEQKFKVYFINWEEKIKEKAYYYFLSNDTSLKHKEYTSFNKNSIDFYHSVYVKSEYFNNFKVLEKGHCEGQIKTENFSTNFDGLYKELKKELMIFLSRKRKDFIESNVPSLIKRYEEKGVFPKYKDNKYDQERKKDFEEVFGELYCVKPTLFRRLSTDQEKTLLGFLNLLLDSDERKNVLNIVEQIVELTEEERAELSFILKKTDLRKITNTIKLIESRYTVIEALKMLVYELNKYTTERDHIQTIVEKNYWLFGEQYHLVSADERFEKSLLEYRKKIGFDTMKDSLANEEKNRRPDVFICRKRMVEYPNSTELEENIIVELKRPRVILNKEVYRQIEDYKEIIKKEKQFNSELRKWKFYIVSTDVDEFIIEKRKSMADKGRNFLVDISGNFEIYAMTWDDVFKNFEISHKYLYSQLEYDKSIIEEELKAKGIDISSDGANSIILELKREA